MTFGPVLDAALQAQQVCINTGYRFCVIGGVALQRWGEPRFTADADLSVLVEPGQESHAVRCLLDELPARIEDAAGFAERTRVVLAQSDQGVGIDIVLAGLPFEERVIERSSFWQLDDSVKLRTCSAEDLLVMKAFAARDKDWADVTSVLERQAGKLDLDRVRSELAPLAEAKPAPEIIEQFQRRVQLHYRAAP
jgi:hypothetical protein